MRFDKDKDGKLNEKEKAACIQALKNENFEDRFLFGLDANAPINDNNDPELLRNRTLCIGGKVVQQEFYGDIDDKCKFFSLFNPFYLLLLHFSQKSISSKV